MSISEVLFNLLHPVQVSHRYVNLKQRLHDDYNALRLNRMYRFAVSALRSGCGIPELLNMSSGHW